MTRRVSIASAALWSAITLVLMSVGCQQSTSSKGARSDARPPAEESFDEIAQIVKNALETGAGGVQGGFVSEQANARSHFSVRNDVTSELIRPASPGDNYKATITVTSRTNYSIRHIPDSEKKSGEKDKSKNGGADSGTNPLDDPQTNGNNPHGVEGHEDSMITSSSKATRALPGPAEDSVARRADEEIRTYELVYENNRWDLKTKLDLKTELAVKNAFDYALKLQP
jgi:hypothetical protein